MADLPPTRHIDTSAWPLLRYTGPARISDDEMREVVEESRMLRALGRPHGLVLDLRQTEGITPVQRRMITAGMAEAEAGHRAAGVALIFDNAALRGILTAIFWIKPAVTPTRVFKTPEEGVAWVLAQLRAKAA